MAELQGIFFVDNPKCSIIRDINLYYREMELTMLIFTEASFIWKCISAIILTYQQTWTVICASELRGSRILVAVVKCKQTGTRSERKKCTGCLYMLIALVHPWLLQPRFITTVLQDVAASAVALGRDSAQSSASKHMAVGTGRKAKSANKTLSKSNFRANIYFA